jgi:hypothetical protein
VIGECLLVEVRLHCKGSQEDTLQGNNKDLVLQASSTVALLVVRVVGVSMPVKALQVVLTQPTTRRKKCQILK